MPDALSSPIAEQRLVGLQVDLGVETRHYLTSIRLQVEGHGLAC